MKLLFFFLIITLFAYRKKNISTEQFLICLALIVAYMLARDVFRKN